jgi:hypothetical protein
MATGMQNGDQFIKSNEDAHPIDDSKSGYGQNGFLGPSSDTKIGATKSGFLPDPVAPVNSQLNPGRVNGREQYAAAHGTRNRLLTDSYPQIPPNGRPVKK